MRERLQRRAAPAATTAAEPAASPGKETLAETLVSAASGGGGQPLPAQLQRKFEGSLGVDLGGVRVHTGGDAAAAADSVQARACTVGQDIYFGAGEYDPHGPTGQELLAHEVSHAAQQQLGAATGAQPKLRVSQPGDPLEVEADQAAMAMVAGEPAAISGGAGLMRQARPGATESAIEHGLGQVGGPAGVVPGHSGGVAHGVENVAHAAEFVADLIELACHSFAAGLIGFAAGGLATMLGPALQLNSAHEFTQAAQRAQTFAFGFSRSFAQSIRFEGALTGPGGAEGYSAAVLVQAYLHGHGISAADVAKVPSARIAHICYQQIRSPLIRQLVHLQEGRMFWIPGTESNAVPNAEEIARAYLPAND